MTDTFSHRLDGLEPDNLLAFMALLGLLRAVDVDDRERPSDAQLRPRVGWDLDTPPLRPRVFLARDASREVVSAAAARGVDVLAATHDFGGRKGLNHSRTECRTLLERESEVARVGARDRIDLLAALMSDGAIKEDKDETVAPTPLCLLFGQGHQHFLDRLATVPRQSSPPSVGKRKNATVPAADCLRQALFEPWHRSDQTFAFRWDPEEDVRYALMAGDPTDTTYKTGTQHGANRLAAVGLAALTVAPQTRRGRVRPTVVGGAFDSRGAFSLAWPVWRAPASLATVRALLAHPDLRKPDGLAHLGVDHVLVARRISVGQFMNFSRARPQAEA